MAVNLPPSAVAFAVCVLLLGALCATLRAVAPPRRPAASASPPSMLAGIGGNQGVEGDEAEGRWAINDDEIKGGQASQGIGKPVRAAIGIDQLDLRSGQGWGCGGGG